MIKRAAALGLLGWAILVSTVWADPAPNTLDKASVLGLKLGDTYEEVMAQEDFANWRGVVGNPRFRAKGSLKSVPPINSEPYDAQLTPPSRVKYLGGDLSSLNLYFDYEDGEFKLFAISFAVKGAPLDKIFTKQFGPMTTPSGWSGASAMLLLQGEEVLLFDIKRRTDAEVWYHANKGGF